MSILFGNCTFSKVVSLAKWYVTNIKPWAQLSFTLTDLMYNSLSCLKQPRWKVHLVSGLGTLPVTANLNFWSRAIFRNLPLPEKCTDPERNNMRTQSVCGFFLTWVGSYENHCFGTDAHTFVFQVGHPTFCNEKVYTLSSPILKLNWRWNCVSCCIMLPMSFQQDTNHAFAKRVN